jgi:hypothetical protein
MSQGLRLFNLLLALVLLSAAGSAIGQIQCANERLILAIDEQYYFTELDGGDLVFGEGDTRRGRLPRPAEFYDFQLTDESLIEIAIDGADFSFTGASEGYGRLYISDRETGFALNIGVRVYPDTINFTFPSPAPWLGVFEGGISVDGGQNFARLVNRTDQVFVGGRLCPYTEHVGEIGNIYVIVGMRSNGELREYMLNKNGELSEAKYPNYEPFIADVKLGDDIELTFFEGVLDIELKDVTLAVSYSLQADPTTLFFAHPRPLFSVQ